MATAFTFNWRVQCKRDSLVDQEIYYVDLATGTPKAVGQDLAKELERRGYKSVELVLQSTLP